MITLLVTFNYFHYYSNLQTYLVKLFKDFGRRRMDGADDGLLILSGQVVQCLNNNRKRNNNLQ